MAKKTVSLRLPEAMVDRLSATGSINAAVERDLDRLQRIRAVSLNELRGIFTAQEWAYLYDCFNGTIIDSIFSTSVTAMKAAIEDHAQLNGADTQWCIDLNKMLSTVDRMTGAHVEAVYNRIEEYWGSENREEETWYNW